MMKRNLMVGVLIGLAVGAVVVESWQPAADAVCKSKQMLKNKVDEMSRKCCI